MEIVELHDLSEKRKWMKRFAKAYKNGEVKDRPEVYSDRVRFFVAKEGSSDLGFIRINNKTQNFRAKLDFEIWNAADAFVKPVYRSKGVLKDLLLFVMANAHVKMCTLDPVVLSESESYYKNLRFTKAVWQPNEIYLLLHQGIENLIGDSPRVTRLV